jgi:hypothetical protein
MRIAVMLKGISMGQRDAPYYGWYVAAAWSAVAFITN